MEDQFIGSYKIIQQWGAGGMAKVYLAVHKDIPNLKVILKILSDPRLVERFRNEADKLALLDGHANICRIKHFFKRGDDTIIVMEFIDGVTLDDNQTAGRKMPISEAVRIIIDVLDVISFAHSKGVYHRDIKPSNIMLEKSGLIKVIDFGIAKAKTDPNLTAAGSACGTPTYMAPEQFTPTESTNYALVDIYAVGTTLFRLLAGECPFKGDNEFAIRDAKLFNDPPKPRSINPEIPKQLEDIILKSLKKEPEKRYQSADAMRQALLQTGLASNGQIAPEEQTIEIGKREAPTPRPKVDIGGRKNRGKGRLLGIVGALVIILAAVVWMFWPKEGGTQAFGAIEITASPIVDEIFLDDSLVSVLASNIIVLCATGQHVLSLTNYDAIEQTFTETLTVHADDTLRRSYSFDIPPLPTGIIAITVKPTADEIWCDDKLVASKKSSAQIECDEGLHTIRLTNAKATKNTFSDTIRVVANHEHNLSHRFTIRRKTPTEDIVSRPKPDSGELTIASRPRGAVIFIDGARQDFETPFTFKLKIGTHVIGVKLNQYGSLEEKYDTVTVRKGTEENIFFEFEK